MVDSVKGLVPTFRAQLPASVDLDVMLDRSESIRASVAEVQFTLTLAIGLVVLVIFLFLRKVTATIIPALALPISLIGTFAGMYLLGYSIDNLSLLALTLSVGFVVDDAIVMLENIVRHIENGERPFEAALRGSRQIAFTILSITLSLVAVFIPVLFMGGVVGRLFREFAVTISITILVSGIVSLTLTPLLCSRLLRADDPSREGAFQRRAAAAFDALRRLYERALRLALGHRRAMLAATLLSLAGALYLFVAIPKGFVPTEDTGLMVVTTEAPQGISFEAMSTAQREAARIIQADPAVAAVNSTVGAGGPNSALNSGRMFVGLKPLSERKASVTEVIQRLRAKLADLASIRVFMQPVQSINVGGRFSRSQYQYTIQGTDLAELQRLAPEIEARMRKLPGLQDVTSDLEVDSPQVFVDINREKAAALDVTADAIRDTLYSAFGSRQVATIYTATNDYEVILEVAPKYEQDVSALSSIYVRSSTGQLVPLDAVSTIRRMAGPVTVSHQSQLPAVTLSFNLSPGVSLGQAVEEIQGVERDMRLPATVTTSFQGTAQLFQDALAGQGLLLLAAVFVIYVVLGILYESFVHPITILSGLPAAGLGALITLMLFGMDLDVIAIIGIVMLIGIVKKNAIMMIDFALDRRRNARRHGGGGDLRGLPAALPADHDDHDGGDPGRDADRDRLRRRLGAAAAARRRRGRRPSGLAAADPLHHAGDLSLSRAGARVVRGASDPRPARAGAARSARAFTDRGRRAGAGNPTRLLNGSSTCQARRSSSIRTSPPSCRQVRSAVSGGGAADFGLRHARSASRIACLLSSRRERF